MLNYRSFGLLPSSPARREPSRAAGTINQTEPATAFASGTIRFFIVMSLSGLYMALPETTGGAPRAVFGGVEAIAAALALACAEVAKPRSRRWRSAAARRKRSA